MKFKVGNKVRLIKDNNNHASKYKIGYIGLITEIEYENEKYWVDNTWCCSKNELELVIFTKSNLKDGDIATFRNGDKRIKAGHKFSNKTSYLLEDDFTENLTIKSSMKQYDIIKVERPVQYKTVYERKEEILDEAEKRYLRDVIRPFKNTARYIEKEDNGQVSRIKICFDYHFMFFPVLEEEKRMYEGMQANRAYTIKELRTIKE